MLEHSLLEQLLEGKRSPLWICNIPYRAMAFLGCSTGAVYLSKDSTKHILEKHKDISTYDLLLLPIAIEKGELYQDPKRPQMLTSIYLTEGIKGFNVPMKIANKGHELWVSSMYRVNDRQIQQKRQKQLRV